MMSWPTCFSLHGQNALVTGASRGLGYVIAQALVAAGARVWLNGRDANNLTQVIQQLHQTLPALAQPGEAHALPFDITDPLARQTAFNLIAQQGGLHILINNVGQRDRRALEAFDLKDVQDLLNTNLLAPFELARQAAQLMRQQSHGRIINITSIAGPLARSGDAVYTMAKGGLDALTRALAAELGSANITVNAVAPGYFATETNQSLVADPQLHTWLKQRTSLGRWGRPDEISGVVVFLASAAASYITGQTIAIDGGYSAHF